jgi:WXG100 family type VII secretion target
LAELSIPSNDLRRVAEAFADASKESQSILKRLEETTSDLEEKWEGATQQVFYQHYKDWHAHMEIYADLLTNISRELQGLAERFEEADATESHQ